MRRTRLSPISPKRAARKAEEKSAGAWLHMERVKGLPCCACGAAAPSQAHHVTGGGKRRSDWRVIPLCWRCHQGPEGFHAAKKSWRARHGSDDSFLPAVWREIYGDDPA